MRILFWAADAMEALCVLCVAAEVVCCGWSVRFLCARGRPPAERLPPGPIGAPGEQRAPRRGPAPPNRRLYYRTGPCWSYRTANYVSPRSTGRGYYSMISLTTPEPTVRP